MDLGLRETQRAPLLPRSRSLGRGTVDIGAGSGPCVWDVWPLSPAAGAHLCPAIHQFKMSSPTVDEGRGLEKEGGWGWEMREGAIAELQSE